MTTTTARVVRDQIKNTIDYLIGADLALYANEVSMSPSRVSWHSHNKSAPFLTTREHPTIDQYMAWVTAGAYSAILLDGSLLQLTYDVSGGDVVGHRLAYIPCPYDLDANLLAQGEPIVDVVDLYRDSDAALRSPVRFEYDPRSAKPGHPAVHLTINAPGCRIACVAPLHVLRFVDFVFRHFYPELWRAHQPFFYAAGWQHIGTAAIADEEHRNVHLMWDVHATAASLSLGR